MNQPWPIDHQYSLYRVYRSNAIWFKRTAHGEAWCEKHSNDWLKKATTLWRELKKLGYPEARHTAEKCVCPLCLVKELGQ